MNLLSVGYDVICIIDTCAYVEILRNTFSDVCYIMYKLPVLQTRELVLVNLESMYTFPTMLRVLRNTLFVLSGTNFRYSAT